MIGVIASQGTLVSVIVPVYNEAEYIGECIESIRRQTGIRIEIIVIDDGSTDETGKVVEGYRDDNLRYFRIPNSGAGIARNMGIEHAQGDFLAFLDADDMYRDEDALLRMTRACQDMNVSICGSYRCEMRDNSITDAGMFRELGALPCEGKIVRFCDFQYDFFFQSYIYESNFVRKYRLGFPSYRRYEDPPFLLRALDAAGRFAVLPVTLHCYRKGHQDRSKNREYIADSLSGLRDNLQYSIERGYTVLAKLSLERCETMFHEDVMSKPDANAVSMVMSINDMGIRSGLIENDLPLVGELRRRGVA